MDPKYLNRVTWQPGLPRPKRANRPTLASILTAEKSVDLLVLQTGYRPVELDGVSVDTAVTLETFPEIVVRIAGVKPELPPGHSLHLSLIKKGRREDSRRLDSDFMSGTVDSWLWPTTPMQALSAGEDVRLPVEGDGIHTVRLSVRNTTTGRSGSVQGTEPAEVEVRIAAGAQRFEIRIPEDGLRAAIERARHPR